MNFSPAGSSVGVTDIEQNTVQFGELRGAHPDAGERQRPAPSSRSPSISGGVALSYNVPGITSWPQARRSHAGGIFLGKITTGMTAPSPPSTPS